MNSSSQTEREGTLTSVPGLRVGHAQVPDGGSGCTVVLGPFRGAVEVSGMATGTREMETLDAIHLVPKIDALLLTGGSAFGLAAADGVTQWLAAAGRGFDTGSVRVPIVPAAVIFDLTPEGDRPDARTGWQACEESSTRPVTQGRVGAGAGATVGKMLGPGRSVPGGLGSAAVIVGAHTVAALAVVNALGDVVDDSGRVVAGALADDGGFLGPEGVRDLLGAGGPHGFSVLRPGQNTTLSVVATDAGLSRVDLLRLARMAGAALPRRISPVGTPFDGDVTFALSTAEEETPSIPSDLLALGMAARRALEVSIVRAVTPSLSPESSGS